MIHVIKIICGLALVILILNEGLSIMEKYSGCKEIRRRAFYSLLPGKPCADFETRIQLEGNFLNCNEAEKIASSSIYRCAVSSWLSEWLPTRVMEIVSEHPMIYFFFMMLMIILFYYITALAFVADRANARRYNLYPKNPRYFHDGYDDKMIMGDDCGGRITYIDNDEDNYYQGEYRRNKMYNSNYH